MKLGSTLKGNKLSMLTKEKLETLNRSIRNKETGSVI